MSYNALYHTIHCHIIHCHIIHCHIMDYIIQFIMSYNSLSYNDAPNVCPVVTSLLWKSRDDVKRSFKYISKSVVNLCIRRTSWITN